MSGVHDPLMIDLLKPAVRLLGLIDEHNRNVRRSWLTWSFSVGAEGLEPPTPSL